MKHHARSLSIVLALAGASPALAQEADLPWNLALPDHTGTVIEARVLEHLGPRKEPYWSGTWVRLAVLRCIQGELPRTVDAHFMLSEDLWDDRLKAPVDLGYGHPLRTNRIEPVHLHNSNRHGTARSWRRSSFERNRSHLRYFASQRRKQLGLEPGRRILVTLHKGPKGFEGRSLGHPQAKDLAERETGRRTHTNLEYVRAHLDQIKLNRAHHPPLPDDSHGLHVRGHRLGAPRIPRATGDAAPAPHAHRCPVCQAIH